MTQSFVSRILNTSNRKILVGGGIKSLYVLLDFNYYPFIQIIIQILLLVYSIAFSEIIYIGMCIVVLYILYDIVGAFFSNIQRSDTQTYNTCKTYQVLFDIISVIFVIYIIGSDDYFLSILSFVLASVIYNLLLCVIMYSNKDGIHYIIYNRTILNAIKYQCQFTSSLIVSAILLMYNIDKIVIVISAIIIPTSIGIIYDNTLNLYVKKGLSGKKMLNYMENEKYQQDPEVADYTGTIFHHDGSIFIKVYLPDTRYLVNTQNRLNNYSVGFDGNRLVIYETKKYKNIQGYKILKRNTQIHSILIPIQTSHSILIELMKSMSNRVFTIVLASMLYSSYFTRDPSLHNILVAGCIHVSMYLLEFITNRIISLVFRDTSLFVSNKLKDLYHQSVYIQFKA